ncbi:hypothetical protein OSH11_17215 [Kaistia dalseonensis]|uniref:Uncharacterized protein n=1 Tax=Kaistia dalseonensis TaxID=410840 RepID=A0ABU0H9S0_9HYPH|nr:hypothetical protein [Kaistia dalseonensis]MCX5496450.1 hypothetical protein [Kaistia dalseonensis]MDQ0439071.1 hypothetical protein [Kaistia dalseonensis]
MHRPSLRMLLAASALLVAAGSASVALSPPMPGRELMVLHEPRRARLAVRRRYPKTGASYPSNGRREWERRQKQIASGRLTEANGLVRNAA